MATLRNARLQRSPSLAIRVAGLYVFVGILVGFGVFYQTVLKQPVEPVANSRLVVEQLQPSLPTDIPVKTGSPSRLIVERLNLELPIKNGYYNSETSEWTLSDTDAFYATMTDRPNDDRGSTFIYGHNRPTAFEPLKNIKSGDTVKVVTTNGLIFTYSYARDALIQPTTTNVLNEDPDTPQLVLMTCEGIFNEVRRTMYFTFKGVHDA